jgi:hypothetical protein
MKISAKNAVPRIAGDPEGFVPIKDRTVNWMKTCAEKCAFKGKCGGSYPCNDGDRPLKKYGVFYVKNSDVIQPTDASQPASDLPA